MDDLVQVARQLRALLERTATVNANGARVVHMSQDTSLPEHVFNSAGLTGRSAFPSTTHVQGTLPISARERPVCGKWCFPIHRVAG